MKKIGVSILLVCTLLVFIVSPIFGDVIRPSATINDSYNLIDTTVTLYVAGYSSDPYIKDYQWASNLYYTQDVHSNSSGNIVTTLASVGSSSDSFVVCVDTQIGLRINNNTDYNVILSHNRISGALNITHTLSSIGNSDDGWYISSMSDNISYINFSANNLIVYPASSYQYNNQIMVPAHGSFACYFTVTSVRASESFKTLAAASGQGYTTPPVTPAQASASFVVTSLSYTKQFPTGINSFTNDTVTYDADINSNAILNRVSEIETIVSTYQTYLSNISSKSNSINSNVQSILDAYTSNTQGAQNLVNDTDSNDQKLDTIHQNEAQWYSQNQQAIESTGLSNFEFSTDQVTGLTGVFSLFQRLWNSMGEYTFVITFTLMMSFAAFFLRHRPIKATTGNNYSRKDNNHGSST